MKLPAPPRAALFSGSIGPSWFSGVFLLILSCSHLVLSAETLLSVRYHHQQKAGIGGRDRKILWVYMYETNGDSDDDKDDDNVMVMVTTTTMRMMMMMMLMRMRMRMLMSC